MLRIAIERAIFSLSAATMLTLQLMAPIQTRAADFSLAPSIAVSEEYNDNIFETEVNKTSDYITRVRPGFAMKYNALLWDWNLGYLYDYRYYAKNSREDDSTYTLNAKGLVRIVDEFFYLDMNDVYQRVSLDVTRDTTNESLFLNQTDQNVGSVSPYLVFHPNARTILKTGYRYVNTWYEDPQAVSKQDHLGFINGSYELSPKLFLTGDYIFTREIPDKNSNFYRHEVYIGPRYEYAEKSFIYAQGGFIATDYDNGSSLFNPSWKAGVTHTIDTVTANVSSYAKYSDDPLGAAILETSYAASLTKSLKRGSITLKGSYTEFSDETAGVLKDKRYSGGFNSTYELMPALSGTLGLTYENYRQMQPNGTTNKYFVDCGLNYSFGRELTAGLSYKYIDYSSATFVQDNYRVNRVSLEMKKVF